MHAVPLRLLPSWRRGLHGAAQEAADLNDFKLETQQLADLCSATDPFYTEAMMFCYGVLEGLAQYHNAARR